MAITPCLAPGECGIPLVWLWKSPVIIPCNSFKASSRLLLGLEEGEMVLSHPAASLGHLESLLLEALLSLLKRDVVTIVSDVVDSCESLRRAAH